MPSVLLALTDSIRWPPCCLCPSCGLPYARPKGGHWRTCRTLAESAFDRSPMRADVMQKIRFGVLSTAQVGVQKVIPAMQKGEHTEVVAIASRSLDKARDMARHLGIPHWHGSYEALLADPDVDAVYNPLPNDQHVPWSIRALEAGKHVLCEKPTGLSHAQGRVLVEAARRRHHLKVMEALMYRHHPQWRKAKELVETGQIGELRAIQVFFSFYNDDPGNI